MDNFHYNKDDFIFISSWKQLLVQSNFDKKIKNDWCAKEKLGLFRYKYENLQVIKVPGKYGFLAVLNIDRGTKRRKPNLFDSTTEPFNNDLFNFTKIKPGEYLFQISNISNNNDILAINASPLGDYHSLILPKMNNKLPQVIDEYSLNIVIQCLLLSASPTIRIGFNSLCAFASVNHLHFHLYYLPYKMYLETCDIVNLSGPCYTIIDYPSKGFVFMLKSNELLFDFIKKVMILIDYLQKNNIPHNMYITRALYKDVNYNNCDDIRNCIRIFIWARTPSGEKNMDAFTPATCELFGHLVFKDNSQFIEVSEEKISKILTNVTESVFSSIKKDIKELYLKL